MKKLVLTFSKNFILLFFLLFILLSNLHSIGVLKSEKFHKFENIINSLCFFKQNWTLFSNLDNSITYYYTAVGLLENNKKIDVFEDLKGIMKADLRKAEGIGNSFRWRRYLLTIEKYDVDEFYKLFAVYLVKNYNKKNKIKLKKITIYKHDTVSESHGKKRVYKKLLYNLEKK